MKILKKNLKAKNQFKHTQRRFKQRYGIRLSQDEYIALCGQIASHQAGFIDKITHRVSRFWVQYDDQWYPVIYDRLRKTIVTVLLREWIESDNNLQS